MKRFLLISMLFMTFLLLEGNAFAKKTEVEKFISNHNKALKEHNLEELSSCYDKNFVSVDGVNLDEMIKMLDSTKKTFKTMDYSIKSIVLDENEELATVYMKEKTKAIINPTRKGDKKGKLEGLSKYIVNLKKENGAWKIVSDKVLSEETTIKYGVARKSDIELVVPSYITNGEEYDISLKVENLKNLFALGSISKEEISPNVGEYKEKFRRIPQEGELERVVRANEKNRNEYAMASVGFTKVTINQEKTKAKIRVLGVGYVIKRINMLEEKKEELTMEKKNVKG